MKKIIANLNQEKGFHCRFGQEGKVLKKFLEEHKNEEVVTIYIATCTQLLLVDIYSKKNKIELEVYDEDGKKFKNIAFAHKYTTDEYVFGDLFEETDGVIQYTEDKEVD